MYVSIYLCMYVCNVEGIQSHFRVLDSSPRPGLKC